MTIKQHTGLLAANLRQRVESTTRPRVQGFRGPMFDGYLADNETAVIRYEDAATYKLMTGGKHETCGPSIYRNNSTASVTDSRRGWT